MIYIDENWANKNDTSITPNEGEKFNCNYNELIKKIEQCGVSGLDYILKYPDLLSALPFDEVEGLSHFVEFGASEGRVPPLHLQWNSLKLLAESKLLPQDRLVALIEALVTAHNQQRAEGLINWRYAENATIERAREFGGRPVLVFGDSHSILYLTRHPIMGEKWILPVDFRCIGASARGLATIPSTSGNGEMIRRFVNSSEKAILNSDEIIFKFGQVDLEFVYYYNLLTRNLGQTFSEDHFLDFATESADRYFSFLESLFLPRLRSQISVASVFPPTLSDEHWAEGYLKAHIGIAGGGAAFIRAEEALRSGQDPAPELSRLIRNFDAPNQVLRTRLHARFNEMLKDRAEALGFKYRDDFTPFLGTSGIVDARYTKDKQGKDHHLDPSTESFGRMSEVLWTFLS